MERDKATLQSMLERVGKLNFVCNGKFAEDWEIIFRHLARFVAESRLNSSLHFNFALFILISSRDYDHENLRDCKCNNNISIY